MTDCSESKINIRDTAIHLRRGGSGEPMLFLHGASGVAGWVPSFAALAGSYDLLVPDHPTYGLSAEPDWLRNMDDLAMFYLDFLDEMDLSGVHLVGNSLGGWLAMEIAVRNSTRLKSLTLVGAAGIRIKGKPIADIFMMDPDDLVREIFVNQSFADNILNMELSEEQVDIQIRNRVATARLGWQPRLFNPHLRKWLHRISLPTHVIWGDTDRIIDPAYAAEFGKIISGSKVTIIENAGHLPHVEQSGPFVEATLGFINSQVN
ncbi:MAG: alpha/beta hydrolase [Pseudomonadota bacterium]|nr:alpha/beta hydrolase [Pseudomonadota bacterium]